jgi:hypothetical protein
MPQFWLLLKVLILLLNLCILWFCRFIWLRNFQTFQSDHSHFCGNWKEWDNQQHKLFYHWVFLKFMVLPNTLHYFLSWNGIEMHDISNFEVVDPVIEFSKSKHISVNELVLLVFPQILNFLELRELLASLHASVFHFWLLVEFTINKPNSFRSFLNSGFVFIADWINWESRLFTDLSSLFESSMKESLTFAYSSTYICLIELKVRLLIDLSFSILYSSAV